MRIGIDEVGRGPFAGPVLVCAFGSTLTDKQLLSIFPDKKLKDSKKLNKNERESIYKQLLTLKKEGLVFFETGKTSPVYIDKYGLTKAITTSLSKALNSVLVKTQKDAGGVSIVLDGGLRAPSEYKKQKTIIKGDEKHVIIACASIIAKVLRDRIMTNLAKTHPYYGFEVNAGYGTRGHQDAIRKHGPSKVHRMLFLRNMLKNEQK
jgi:ribonuclease HII